MRNIARVVLWGLPPSFCALVQRGGRAGRDFGTLGEAILIVPATVIKNGTKETDVESAVQEAADDSQAENRGDEEREVLEQHGIELAGGNEQVLVNDGGVRVEQDSEPEEEPQDKPKRRKKFTKKDSNSLEARYLTLFACAARCLRVIWDEFFGNANKRKGSQSKVLHAWMESSQQSSQFSLSIRQQPHTRDSQELAAATSVNHICSQWRS